MTRIYLREDEKADEAVANGHCPTCGQPLAGAQIDPLGEFEHS